MEGVKMESQGNFFYDKGQNEKMAFNGQFGGNYNNFLDPHFIPFYENIQKNLLSFSHLTPLSHLFFPSTQPTTQLI